jgi:hypothetical protein
MQWIFFGGQILDFGEILVHNPLETQYDSVVDELQIDEPQLSYLGNLHRRCYGYFPLTLPR